MSKRDYLPFPSPDEPGVMLVPLTRNQFAKIDADDYDLIADHRWYAKATTYGGFTAAHKSVGGPTLQMHRVLANTPNGSDTDHKNGDTLDNRRSNLRACSRGQNLCNRRSKRTGVSVYLGVDWHKASGKWRAKICKDRNQRLIGMFTDEIEAAKAYDAAARELHGDFARLNFP